MKNVFVSLLSPIKRFLLSRYISIQIKVKGENIETVNNMLDYKLKVIHVEYYKLSLFPIRHKYNSCTKIDNSCCNYYVTVVPENRGFYWTVIPDKWVFRGNSITTSTDLGLQSLQIGGTKYRIYSSKTDTAKNNNIYKFTEIMESNTIL